MSRSGYSDNIEQWVLIRWRGAVRSAIRGKRGQVFLRDVLGALDGMPEKRLIASELESEGEVCTLGAVGKQRGLDMLELDPCDHKAVAQVFGIAHALACEIMYENDEGGWRETPEQRWTRMRAWIVANLKQPDHG